MSVCSSSWFKAVDRKAVDQMLDINFNAGLWAFSLSIYPLLCSPPLPLCPLASCCRLRESEHRAEGRSPLVVSSSPAVRASVREAKPHRGQRRETGGDWTQVLLHPHSGINTWPVLQAVALVLSCTHLKHMSGDVHKNTLTYWCQVSICWPQMFILVLILPSFYMSAWVDVVCSVTVWFGF